MGLELIEPGDFLVEFGFWHINSSSLDSCMLCNRLQYLQ